MHPSSKHTRAFTFIELLVVMILVAILASIAYPAYTSVMERARKTQAKNDLTQIVTAVNAYYTEYGKYPLPTGTTTDTTYGATNNVLFDVLRNMTGTTPGNALNPRAIVFIQPPLSATGNKSGLDSNGIWYDPWGSPYNVAIDGNYNNIATAPSYIDLATNYITATDSSGDIGVGAGVITWALGKNGAPGGGPPPPPPPAFTSEPGTPSNFFGSGDVISWQ